MKLNLFVTLFFISTIAGFAQSLVQRPFNDDFANALDIGAITTAVLNGSLSGATVEPGEPFNLGGVASVWFKLRPMISGRVFSNKDTHFYVRSVRSRSASSCGGRSLQGCCPALALARFWAAESFRPAG